MHPQLAAHQARLFQDSVQPHSRPPRRRYESGKYGEAIGTYQRAEWKSSWGMNLLNVVQSSIMWIGTARWAKTENHWAKTENFCGKKRNTLTPQ